MRKSAIAGLITIAVCIGILVSLNADTSSYSDFAGASASKKEEHVVGCWEKAKGTYYDAVNNPNHFSFYMRDEKGLVKKVVLNGVKPQDFERSEKIVLIGQMNNDVFYASKILMKCPSKYNDNMVEVNQDGTVTEFKKS